jgi:hypothetical protein
MTRSARRRARSRAWGGTLGWTLGCTLGRALLILPAAAGATDTKAVRDGYLAAAAAAEACSGRKLSMIEELRLEQLIRADSAVPPQGRSIAGPGAQSVRSGPIDCADTAVRESARRFVETVVPLLQAPVMRP